MTIELAELIGLTPKNLEIVSGQHQMHKKCINDFNAMCSAALEDGIDIGIASSFRSFDRQRVIWNSKFEGKMPILDANETPINIYDHSEQELVLAILNYSAIPGFSRHHWGSDVDVFDVSQLPHDYELQLVDSEYNQFGIFRNLDNWLNIFAEQYGFYRPFMDPNKAVSMERWHLSHKPTAAIYLQEIKTHLPALKLKLKTLDIKGWPYIESHFDDLVERYLLDY